METRKSGAPCFMSVPTILNGKDTCKKGFVSNG